MARKHAAAQKAAKAKTWAEEEVRMLEKALVKFPQVLHLSELEILDLDREMSSLLCFCSARYCITSLWLQLLGYLICLVPGLPTRWQVYCAFAEYSEG